MLFLIFPKPNPTDFNECNSNISITLPISFKMTAIFSMPRRSPSVFVLNVEWSVNACVRGGGGGWVGWVGLGGWVLR